MKFCQDHWDRLREAIAARGLAVLVPESGQEAAAKFADELTRGRTIDNFDPLMAAHMAVSINAMRVVSACGGSPLYLLSTAPEDPVVGYDGFEGRTWPRCPLCYLNLAHEVSCTDGGCDLPKQTGYDWMIDRAADDALDAWKAMRP